MTPAQLYGHSAEVPWPDNENGHEARKWLPPFMDEPPERRICNVRAGVEVAVAGDVVLPYTVSDHVEAPLNSYVCSPYTHYIAYGREEFHKLGHRLVEQGLDQVVGWLGRWMLRQRFDDVVYVNNWLLSTNLYPRIRSEQVAAIHHALVAAHSDRPIVWRSVDRTGNPEVEDALLRLGYTRCFSRVVWYQDPSRPEVRKRKSFQHDGRLVRRSGYEVVDARDLPDEAFDRIRVLYDKLYLDKYSRHNPQFTAGWLRDMSRTGLLEVRAFRKAGRLDAVYGYYVRKGLATAPLFGYDTDVPQSVGLYRILSRVYADEARDRGWVIHGSAGVGAFKKHRGSEPAIECNLVYHRHLRAPQRRPWQVLAAIMRYVGVPIIRRLEL